MKGRKSPESLVQKLCARPAFQHSLLTEKCPSEPQPFLSAPSHTGVTLCPPGVGGLQFECEPLMVALFGKVVGRIGGGALLEEIG